jgi:hypothetical protein
MINPHPAPESLNLNRLAFHLQQQGDQNESDSLKGWRTIAEFLGQPIAVAQRRANSGMPVELKGRFVYASTEQLNHWLERESGGEPVHVATDSADFRSQGGGLSHVRKHGHARNRG